MPISAEKKRQWRKTSEGKRKEKAYAALLSTKKRKAEWAASKIAILPFWVKSARVLRFKAKGEPYATAEQLHALWLRQGPTCPLSGRPIPGTPHLDHIIPRSKGGSHLIENLRWLHPMANRARSDCTDSEFLIWFNGTDGTVSQQK